MQSEFDEISLINGDTSFSSSPKCTYIVQSPSRDSHDDKSSIISHITPVQSPSHPSHPSHSRRSSESRFSGPFKLIGKHGGQFLKKKRERSMLFSAIDEGDEVGGDGGGDRRCRIRRRVVVVLIGFVIGFLAICACIWGASRPYKLHVQMKSWKLNNFYYGEGSDNTGVPTKLLTLNCSVKMNIKNPATFFGIHVSSTSLNLFYSQIKVGSGEFMSYYQPKRSGRTITINVEGQKVPLYGVGEDFIMSHNNGSVPLELQFELLSQAYLMGPFLKTKYHLKILCIMKIDSQSSKIFDFEANSCSYS